MTDPTDGARYIVVNDNGEIVSTRLLPHDEAESEIEEVLDAVPDRVTRSQLRIERVGDAPGTETLEAVLLFAKAVTGKFPEEPGQNQGEGSLWRNADALADAIRRYETLHATSPKEEDDATG
jgi:hypothetical protein